ncbi:MAG TPA: hypothetical protein VF407_23430 [Polyangiaceae bacterium]
MILASKRSDLVAATLALASLLACGAESLPTTTELPKEPRHPDGVVLEPLPAIPDAGDRAPSNGVVTLREPLGDTAVHDVVEAYFVAFIRADRTSMEHLLTEDAVDLASPGRDRETIFQSWRARHTALEYKKLEGTQIADYDGIERFRYDDLGNPSGEPRPANMQPGDIVIKVPILAARIGTERYFGDTFVFLLRRDGGKYKVAGVEEKQAP